MSFDNATAAAMRGVRIRLVQPEGGTEIVGENFRRALEGLRPFAIDIQIVTVPPRLSVDDQLSIHLSAEFIAELANGRKSRRT